TSNYDRISYYDRRYNDFNHHRKFKIISQNDEIRMALYSDWNALRSRFAPLVYCERTCSNQRIERFTDPSTLTHHDCYYGRDVFRRTDDEISSRWIYLGAYRCILYSRRNVQ